MEAAQYSMVVSREKAMRTVPHDYPRRKKAVSVETLPSS